ncbi:uncharacterized protein BDZ83DRAFT_646371 [Colletotrichum acutatum]|uniref:Alcohol dehydrogenase n=1 Tax=Glomerella acutata TaxID=27357 RepID=A0AAD9D1X2_GLOAC|nr:uncharacterized protein BDZ83DRAFT_646371 [Colletotrichum acutatum]KAK1730928.1 hypothetical protein BDZ83DRAFT_646371 [Colletotrichum acutatum]
MKHKHAQTHDEVSAEPELSYDVMGTGPFKLFDQLKTFTYRPSVESSNPRTSNQRRYVKISEFQPRVSCETDSNTTAKDAAVQEEEWWQKCPVLLLLLLVLLDSPHLSRLILWLHPPDGCLSSIAGVGAAHLLDWGRKHKIRCCLIKPTWGLRSSSSFSTGPSFPISFHLPSMKISTMPDLINTVSQVALSLVAIGNPLQAMVQSVPRPGSGEVLICVEATGLLALDQKLRDFGVFNIASRLHLVLGIDIVGTVVEYGMSIAPRKSSSTACRRLGPVRCRRFSTLDSRPRGNVVPQAATLITNPFTAALSLFHSSGLGVPFPSTDTTFEYQKAHVIVLGAGTNVSTLIVRLAAIAGIGTIIATSSKASFATPQTLGATHVIDRSSSSIPSDVQTILGSLPLNVVETYASGHPTLAASLFIPTSVSKTIVMLSSSAGADIDALAERGISLRNVYGSFEAHLGMFQSWAVALTKWLLSGELEAPSHVVIPSVDPHLVNAALDDIGKGDGSHGGRAKWVWENAS